MSEVWTVSFGAGKLVDDEELRAAMSAKGLGTRAAIIENLLKEKDERMRYLAAFALGKIGPAAKEAVPALIAALKDKVSNVRSFAARALSKIGPATVPI